ncbi:hypothetical protein V6N13_124203 [Hibiscus sabdariffa]|uniref:Reticulon-like protein n=1 Tax=Hibiscus sabdariffa TaxID=183260 RepID=A0ABR2S0Z2_9ROSI
MGDSNVSLRTSVHKAFGGGRVADVILWRRWCGGAMVLVSATTMWYLFEIAGYNFLSFMANVLLLHVVILFFWAKSASLLNRPLPPIPNMEISERTIGMVSDELHGCINCVLAIAHDITIGRNLKLFIKVSVGLWFVSFIGSLVNFLTLVYIGVILLLSVPAVYEKKRRCSRFFSWLSVTRDIGLGFQDAKLLVSFCSMPSILRIPVEFL